MVDCYMWAGHSAQLLGLLSSMFCVLDVFVCPPVQVEMLRLCQGLVARAAAVLGLVLVEWRCCTEVYLATQNASLLVLALLLSCLLGLLLSALALAEMCVLSVVVLQAMSGHCDHRWKVTHYCVE